MVSSECTRVPVECAMGQLLIFDSVQSSGSILSVESNQNVESESGKCGVQNSIFTSRNQLF